MTYYKRIIDKKLLEWKASQRRKPLLIRGARQVGKSSAVRHFGKEFKYFVEINLESQPSIRGLFSKDIDVHRTCESISATTGIPVIPGETLLFIDEIQVSQEAIMSLRYFKEDYPELCEVLRTEIALLHQSHSHCVAHGSKQSEDVKCPVDNSDGSSH